MNDGEGLSHSLAHYISARVVTAWTLHGGRECCSAEVLPRRWCSNLLEINVNPETDTCISTVEGYNDV